MKRTYLVRSNQENQALVNVSGEEWYQLLNENSHLPKEQRRYFIRDVIIEDEIYDTIVMEVSEDEYKAWKRDAQRSRRNRKYAEQFDLLPLDAPLEVEQDLFLFQTITDCKSSEDAFFTNHVFTDLREALDAWKPWASSLLQLYIKGERRSSTKWLAKTCGVSVQTARSYKREFESFIRNFVHEYFS